MSIGLAYYIILLVWFVFGFVYNRPAWPAIGGPVLEFVLFLLAGWAIFGPPLHG